MPLVPRYSLLVPCWGCIVENWLGRGWWGGGQGGKEDSRGFPWSVSGLGGEETLVRICSCPYSSFSKQACFCPEFNFLSPFVCSRDLNEVEGRIRPWRPPCAQAPMQPQLHQHHQSLEFSCWAPRLTNK